MTMPDEHLASDCQGAFWLLVHADNDAGTVGEMPSWIQEVACTYDGQAAYLTRLTGKHV